MTEHSQDRNTGSDSSRRRGRPASDGGGGSDGGVRSLSRALSLLEDVSSHAGGIALSDLAARAGLAPSTAHRLLKSLENHRFVIQDNERGLWFTGVQAFTVGAGFLRNRDFVSIARPFMHQAMNESGESVNLAILDGQETIYLSQVESRQMMRALAPPGGRAPLHASGVGKAFLAGMPPEEAGALVQSLKFDRYTDKTIRNGLAMMDDVARARRAGYAIDDEEHAVGLRCVASPIFNEFAEPVAAVSISGPMARIADADIQRLGVLVCKTAASITQSFGGLNPSDFGVKG